MAILFAPRRLIDSTVTNKKLPWQGSYAAPRATVNSHPPPLEMPSRPPLSIKMAGLMYYIVRVYSKKKESINILHFLLSPRYTCHTITKLPPENSEIGKIDSTRNNIHISSRYKVTSQNNTGCLSYKSSVISSALSSPLTSSPPLRGKPQSSSMPPIRPSTRPLQ